MFSNFNTGFNRQLMKTFRQNQHCKRVLILARLCMYGLAVIGFLFSDCPDGFAEQSESEELTIAIVQPQNVNAYQEAVQGFLNTLRKNLAHPLNIVIYETPDGLYKTLRYSSSASAEPAGIDLIVTVGTSASAEVARTITKIPIVFSMVLDPQEVIPQRANIVGASLNIPVEFQLKLIKETLPAVKTVGVIYDPHKNAEYVRRLEVVAPQFRLTIKGFPVISQKAIPDALEQVKEETDALLGIVDNTVYTSRTTEFIIRFTVQKYVPFIGLSASYVKAGALCSLVFDNYDIGRQTAQLAEKILSGTPPAILETTVPEKLDIAINLRTANIIGVTIPKHIQRNAAIVYE